MAESNKDQGFTLVELSIVLVIVGLIIGGVLVGAEMVHGTQTRATVRQFESYYTDVTTFKMKYGALPGDYKDAVGVLGVLRTTCPGDGVINGNGDGFINHGGYSEEYQVWRQMSLAGISEFSGTGCRGNGPVIDWNLPSAKLAGGGFLIYDSPYFFYPAVTITGFTVPTGNYMVLAAPSSNTLIGAPALNARDAAAIDLKLDDGKPLTGRMFVLRASTETSGYLTSSAMTATFDYTTDNLKCVAMQRFPD